MTKTLCYDFSVLANPTLTGVERYAVAMMKHLPEVLPEVALIGAWQEEPATEYLEVEGWRHVTTPSRLPRSWWRRRVLPKFVREVGASLLVAPVAHVPSSAEFRSCRTVHDIPDALSERFEPTSASKLARLKRLYAQPVPTIVPSKFTAKSLQPLTESEVRIIAHGVDPIRTAAQDHSSNVPLVLIIGTVRPRRVPDVVNAAAKALKRSQPDVQVVWLGRKDMDTRAFDQITFVGVQDDAIKSRLLSEASLLLCPSLIEGFGLPLLEGLSCGLPVLSADHPTAREVGGEHVGFYDGTSSEDLTRSLLAGLHDSQSSKVKVTQGRVAHAESFTWQKSAFLHAEFFREIMAGS